MSSSNMASRLRWRARQTKEAATLDNSASFQENDERAVVLEEGEQTWPPWVTLDDDNNNAKKDDTTQPKEASVLSSFLHGRILKALCGCSSFPHSPSSQPSTRLVNIGAGCSIILCFLTVTLTKTWFMAIALTCTICLSLTVAWQYRKLTLRAGFTLQEHNYLRKNVLQLWNTRERLYRTLASLDESHHEVQHITHELQSKYCQNNNDQKDNQTTTTKANNVQHLVELMHRHQQIQDKIKQQLQLQLQQQIISVILSADTNRDQSIFSTAELDQLILQLQTIPGIHIANEKTLRTHLAVAMGIFKAGDEDSHQLIPYHNKTAMNPVRFQALLNILREIQKDAQEPSTKQKSLSAQSDSNSRKQVVFDFDPMDLLGGQ